MSTMKTNTIEMKYGLSALSADELTAGGAYRQQDDEQDSREIVCRHHHDRSSTVALHCKAYASIMDR